MKRFIMSAILAIAATCGTPFAALAQATPPVTEVRVAPEAARRLDSLAIVTRETRTETSACLTSYAVRDTVLTVERVSDVRIIAADSVDVLSEGCPLGAPTVHSHVVDNGYLHRPSAQDLETNAERGSWALLLTVLPNGWFVRIY